MSNKRGSMLSHRRQENRPRQWQRWQERRSLDLWQESQQVEKFGWYSQFGWVVLLREGSTKRKRTRKTKFDPTFYVFYIILIIQYNFRPSVKFSRFFVFFTDFSYHTMFRIFKTISKIWNPQPLRTIKLFFCGPKGGLRTSLFVNAQNEKYISTFWVVKVSKKKYW